MHTRNHTSREQGFALIGAIFIAMLLAGMASAFLTVEVRSQRELESARGEERAFYLADAAVSDAAHAVATCLAQKTAIPGLLGSAAAPVQHGGGEYWATLSDNGDGTYTIVATGQSLRASRAIEAVVRAQPPSVFDSALFAGNTSGDPAYSLDFGGSAAQADVINGNVYSGGHVAIGGTAGINGQIVVSGTISGGTGLEGISQGSPDIAGMGYETFNDVDVAAEFAAGTATWTADEAGGDAWQLPAASPAHIFRMNPSDRAAETSGTAKDDFFLEDPYETVGIDAAQDGSDPYYLTLTGDSGPGVAGGSGRMIYVDGNLWLHNNKAFSFAFKGSGGPVAVTFVVKGNVYFSDNLFYGDPAQDGVAFIAMKDPAHSDSGNIYFGDPEFGTLREMHAFMYAENDFYDYNLDAAGSATVRVLGTMSAGNHVSIQRDFGTQHSKLTVDWDDRLLSGAVSLPGLPGFGSGSQGPALQLLSVREVPTP